MPGSFVLTNCSWSFFDKNVDFDPVKSRDLGQEVAN